MVSEIEHGRYDVSLPQLEVMALIYNVPVTYFWSDEAIEESSVDFPTKEAITIRQRIIGVLLRQARTEAKRTQKDLATLLNVSASTISNYEYGKTGIPLQSLEILTEYLNVSLSYFMENGLARKNEPVEQAPTLDEITEYSQLPPEVREFLSNPANLLYVNIAMKLSELSAETLRALAEGLLEVTY
jgi:transcriptional regulator with XRE-family HTH domain